MIVVLYLTAILIFEFTDPYGQSHYVTFWVKYHLKMRHFWAMVGISNQHIFNEKTC